MSERDYSVVRDVMTSTPQVVDGLATVREAVDLMREHGVSSVVVDRRHPGDEYGIVVIHDVAQHVISANRSPDRVNVYEVMSKPVIAVDPEMDIKYAVRLLFTFGLSRAIVTERGNLIGLVTLRELVLRSIADSAPSAP
jgi:CBS domain-containing protein